MVFGSQRGSVFREYGNVSEKNAAGATCNTGSAGRIFLSPSGADSLKNAPILAVLPIGFWM